MAEEKSVLSPGEHETIVELPIAHIHRGHFQPRDLFEPEAMAATKRSIEENGQLYPVVVRKIEASNVLYHANWKEEHYELADGERRYRTCKDLGLKTIKAIIRDLSDEQMLEYALATNDSVPLNPIEKAKVFHILASEFNNSQEEIAKSYNMKQQQVSEYIRLLELPDEVKDLTARAVISIRHARELLKVSDNETIKRLAKDVVDLNLSTRDLSEKVKVLQGKNKEDGFDNSGKVHHSDILFHEDLKKKVESLENIVKDDIKSLEMSKIEEFFNEEEHNLSKTDVGIFREKKKYQSVQPLLSLMAQVNSFILLPPAKKWLKQYLAAKPALKSMTPEVYFAWFELFLAVPTVALYLIFNFAPLVALGLGCMAASILLLKLFEDHQE